MNSTSNDKHPVSVIVDREVLPGKKAEFEQALKGILEASRQFPGYMGTDVSLPDAFNDHHYRVIFRYQTLEQLKTWENSKERLGWIKKIDKLIKEPSELRIITGLETWFALPRVAHMTPPKRYKMAVITWLAITPLLIVFNLLAEPILGKVTMIQRVLVSTPPLVLIMTYLLMPFMARLFSRWLYPKQSGKE